MLSNHADRAYDLNREHCKSHLVVNRLLRVVVKAHAVLGTLVAEEGGDLTEILGEGEELIDKDALLQVRPEVRPVSSRVMVSGSRVRID